MKGDKRSKRDIRRKGIRKGRRIKDGKVI